MYPSVVCVGAAKVGVSAAFRLVPVTVALPGVYPVRVVVMVAVLAVLKATPLTVTSPVPFTTTVPLAVAVPPHTHSPS